MRAARASAAECLHAVATALGVPDAMVPRLIAEVEASAAEWLVPVDDTALLTRLDAWAQEVGVPAETLAVRIVAVEIERLDARARVRRWASDTVEPSHRAPGVPGPAGAENARPVVTAPSL